ncbi:hypothetical protein Lal_00001408 [Lupinus albus]|nr:hypothetical protein Lal_00001408 [Lupinus albus]
MVSFMVEGLDRFEPRKREMRRKKLTALAHCNRQNASPTIEEYEVLFDIALDSRLKGLALAIYGRILFPFVNDMVDQCLVDVLAKFKKFEANPVPAILEDTLLALQRSLEKGIPKIRCCAQLLYITLDEGQKREDHLKASLENTKKTCYDALTEASQQSEQLWTLQNANDELVNNWNEVLKEFRWEKDK